MREGFPARYPYASDFGTPPVTAGPDIRIPAKAVCFRNVPGASGNKKNPVVIPVSSR